MRLFKEISKFTKVNHKFAIEGSFLIAAGSAIAFASTFALSVAFANLLPVEVYGNYKFILSLVGIFSAFSLTGASTVITRSVARGFEGSYHALRLSSFKYSILPAVITVGAGGYYLWQANSILGYSLLIAGLLNPFLNFYNFYGSFLQGKKAFRANVLNQFFYASIPAAALICTSFFTHSVIVLISIYFLSNTLVNFLITRYVDLKYKPGTEIEPSANNFAFHLSLMGILSLVAQNLDKILVFQFVGSGPLAAYSIALALPQQFQVVNKGIKNLVYPSVSERDIHSLNKHIVRYTSILFAISFALFIFYFFAADVVFKIFFPQYIDASLMSKVLALTVFSQPFMIYKLAYFAHNKTKELYIIRILSPIIKIGMLFILGSIYGVWGVIASVLLSLFFETVLYVILYYIYFDTTKQL